MLKRVWAAIVGNRWVVGARPRTLGAAVVPVAVGSSIAAGEGKVSLALAVATVIVALGIQIGTNYINDFADGEKGADINRVGPKRLVASGLATVDQVKAAALISFAASAATGALVAILVDWRLLLVGLMALLSGWYYTAGSKAYGYRGLGELFVFVFFGLVATVGSYFVHTEQHHRLVWICGAVVGCLSVMLMLTNNIRDRENDEATGKKTMVVSIGDQNSRYLFGALSGLVVAGIFSAGLIRFGALVGLVGIPLLAVCVRDVVWNKLTGLQLIPVLSSVAKVQLLIGALMSLGLSQGP